MKEITRYQNSINSIPMRQWTPEEQNFFFAILTQIRDEGTKEFTFKKDQLKEFANYTNRKNTDFIQTIRSLTGKLQNLWYQEETANSFKSMVLFQKFYAYWLDDLSDMELQVQISDNFEYIVNQLTANFTQFELQEFTNLRSTYSKTMFRHLKQWRTKGVIGGYPNGEIPKEDLFIMLGVPASMQRASNFKAHVLKPIIEELAPLFEGLKVKTIKARKAGNPIIAYKFTWKQEKTGTYIADKFNTDIPTSKIKKEIPSWSVPEYKDSTSPEKIALMKKFQELSGKKRSEEITLKELKELESIERKLKKNE